jgi:hypothetical protein
MVYVNYIASWTLTLWFVFVNHIVLPSQNKHVIEVMLSMGQNSCQFTFSFHKRWYIFKPWRVLVWMYIYLYLFLGFCCLLKALFWPGLRDWFCRKSYSMLLWIKFNDSNTLMVLCICTSWSFAPQAQTIKLWAFYWTLFGYHKNTEAYLRVITEDQDS